MNESRDAAETKPPSDDERAAAEDDAEVVEILVRKRSRFAAPPEMPTITIWR